MANFVIKGLRLLVFPGSLVINNHVHFSIHPPSLNKSVHFDPRLLSIKNKKDSKNLDKGGNREKTASTSSSTIKKKFYKYGTQVFYKQLMDILYVNAEEFCRNFRREKYVPHDQSFGLSIRSAYCLRKTQK